MVELSFENPVYLWYFLSIPLVIYTHFYLLKHTRAKAIKFANFEALKRVSSGKLITKNILPLVIRVLVLSCIIISASGVTLWREGKVSDNDFVIAIDISASMAAQDILPSRLEAAKKTAIDFINNLKSKSSVGVISFSGTTFIESMLIDNKDSLKKTIDNIEIAKAGGTDISGAIITGTNMLLGSDKGKAILLITDGSNTVSAFIENSIQNSIDYAAHNHVIIHAIGIGSETGPIGYLPEYYNISAVYNENTLMQISNQTHGFYFKAVDNADLGKVYAEISAAAEKSLIPLKLSYGLMLIALLLLFVEWGLVNTRFRKIP
jgi:Ca-activated chloride channel family protein